MPTPNYFDQLAQNIVDLRQQQLLDKEIDVATTTYTERTLYRSSSLKRQHSIKSTESISPISPISFDSLVKRMRSQKYSKTLEEAADEFNTNETKIINEERDIFTKENLIIQLESAFHELVSDINLQKKINQGLISGGMDEKDISEEIIKNTIKEIFELIAYEIGENYSHHVSSRNWSDSEIEKSRILEEKMDPLINRLGGMIPKNPDNKQVFIYLWSGEGADIASAEAKKINLNGGIGIAFQNTIPGMVLNHIMAGMEKHQLLSWVSEQTKMVYQAASLHLAKNAKPGDNIVVCTPTVNASAIFSNIELPFLIRGGINPKEDIQYYCLKEEVALNFMKEKSKIKYYQAENNEEKVLQHKENLKAIIQNTDSWELTRTPPMVANHESRGTVVKTATFSRATSAFTKTLDPNKGLLRRMQSLADTVSESGSEGNSGSNSLQTPEASSPSPSFIDSPPSSPISLHQLFYTQHKDKSASNDPLNPEAPSNENNPSQPKKT